ncbi:MAG: RHS repeat-associated core domain-containing protein [Thermodesulfovibrionales bacterium]
MRGGEGVGGGVHALRGGVLDHRHGRNNLRFLGQYYDAETGLHQNGHREYKAEVGRYIEGDPIGFAGGINLFAYVGNNPMMFIDPLGLILTNAQVANIIFNETRSFSGDRVFEARLNIAHAIINGDNALGDRRPVTAPTTATVPQSEQATYQQIQFAVELARFQQTEGGIDPTNGAMNFNFRNNDSTSPFYGLPVQTHVGPLNNSYTGGGLNSTGVWANTYGRCNGR